MGNGRESSEPFDRAAWCILNRHQLPVCASSVETCVEKNGCSRSGRGRRNSQPEPDAPALTERKENAMIREKQTHFCLELALSGDNYRKIETGI
jgi:hypothetical protein